jgi:hypothetical protein
VSLCVAAILRHALHHFLCACGARDGAQPNGRIGRWQAVFTLIYVLELVARMHAKGFTKAIMMRKRRLDMVMVLISIVSLVRRARARGWCCGRQ